MDTLDDSLDAILERALSTSQIMTTLSNPPHGWSWTGESPGAFNGRIGIVNNQIEVLALAEATTTVAAATWDEGLRSLVDDAQHGTSLGRFKYKDVAQKLVLFEALQYRNTGRDGQYKQALRFETAWKKADAVWVFKPGMTLAQYALRREAIVNVLEPGHVAAETDERHQRATLHAWAEEMNDVAVNWYRIATSTFAEHSIAGQLIRTIPTTYNPNRPPGEFAFTAHMSTSPNSVHLLWRAARGQRFYIMAQAPGAAEFAIILDGVTDKEWIGLGLAAGAWKFKGYAANADGTGEESSAVTLNVANAMAA